MYISIRSNTYIPVRGYYVLTSTEVLQRYSVLLRYIMYVCIPTT